VDTRIIAATNRDLESEVQARQFRADLYHRINVFTINIPPLRDRVEDIPSLCIQLLKKIGHRLGRGQLPLIDRRSMDLLCSYDWPGNIRELTNVLERALILCDGDKITPSHLNIKTSTDAKPMSTDEMSFSLRVSQGGSMHQALHEVKRQIIEAALARSRGSIKNAAILLGISRDSFVHHMRSLDIRRL